MRMRWIMLLAAVMVLAGGAQAWATELDVDDAGGACGSGTKTLCRTTTLEQCLKYRVVETSISIDGKGGSAGFRLECQEKSVQERPEYYP